MQVSWIDPEEVAALAESLRPPARPQPPAKAPEPVPQEAVQPLVTDAPAPDAEVPGPAADTGGMPNLAAFRQRLQSIRERAIHAGLMTPKPAAPLEPPPPAPAPVADVAPAPAPQPASVPEGESVPPSPSEPQAEPVPETKLAAETTSPPADVPAFEEAASPSPEPEPASPIPAPQWQPQPETVVPPSPPPVQYNVPVAPAPVPPAPQPHIEIVPGASVKDRLDAFAAWAGQQWGPSELLIVDEYGDLLWGPPKKAGLVLSTMMAWNAAIRASAQAANGLAQIQQQVLATGETLTIIPCKTRLGMLQIALVKAQAPWGEETSVLREALVQVMDIPG